MLIPTVVYAYVNIHDHIRQIIIHSFTNINRKEKLSSLAPSFFSSMFNYFYLLLAPKLRYVVDEEKLWSTIQKGYHSIFSGVFGTTYTRHQLLDRLVPNNINYLKNLICTKSWDNIVNQIDDASHQNLVDMVLYVELIVGKVSWYRSVLVPKVWNWPGNWKKKQAESQSTNSTIKMTKESLIMWHYIDWFVNQQSTLH